MTVLTPVAVPIAVPTPVPPSGQKTIPQYFVKKGALIGPKEGEPTSPGEFRWPEEYHFTITDTPPGEFATPEGSSPETVSKCSEDEADTEPTGPREATSDISARINTYKYVRIGDLERLELNERHEKRRELSATACTVWDEGNCDTQGLRAQFRDVALPEEDCMVKYDWRVDLKDSSYRYDRLVEPVGHTGQHEGQTLTMVRMDLRRWSEDQPRANTSGGERADSPVSHNNLWDREEVRSRCDTQGAAGNSGGTTRCDTSSRMYDGGGDLTLVTPPPRTTNKHEQNDERPLRYHKIRVDNVTERSTAARLPSDSVEDLPTTH